MLGDRRTERRADARGGDGASRPIVLEPTPLAERSAFAAKIAAGKFVVSVEVNPAPGLDPSSGARGREDAARQRRRHRQRRRRAARDGAHGQHRVLLAAAAGATASSRSCTCAAATGTCSAQMAHLLGAHAIGIRNLVIITGDPPKVGDYPEATAVYDLDSIGLLQMASNMNRGVDPAGKPLARRPDVVPSRDGPRAGRGRSRQGARAASSRSGRPAPSSS